MSLSTSSVPRLTHSLASSSSRVSAQAQPKINVVRRVSTLSHARPTHALLKGLRRSLDGINSNGTYTTTRFASTFFGNARKIDRLEAEAEEQPMNPQRQAELYREMNKIDPWRTIRRFESGRYASNEITIQEYMAALAKVDRLDRVAPRLASLLKNSQGASPPPTQQASTGSSGYGNHYSSPMAGPGLGASPYVSPPPPAVAALYGGGGGGNETVGSEDRPVHVITHDGAVGIRAQIWRAIKYLGLALVGMTVLSTFLEERSGFKGMNMSHDIEPSTSQNCKFSDVHGVDEAKDQLEEIVAFLRDPAKFTRLGGKLPKGVLLMGPPGTGKTLLAKAIAGEAGVPFFYCSGSEFDEVFVGVGARRVRDLFAAAKRRSPCIIFIDEIDAIGGTRNPRDQQYVKMTLNQLLVELDGFTPNENVIVIGATNFPESLDKALTRPGRFDHHVVVPIPDVRGRTSILKHHSKTIPLAKDVELEVIARGTPGFSGAELANLVNQAAVKAAMDGRSDVAMRHFEFAKDKIIMGAERKSMTLADENRKMVAFHEGGHALVALYTPGALPIHKATIMPRGSALGMVSQLPEQDELNWTKKQLIARLDVSMGGRCAEELIFGEDNITSGASSDIDQATKVARAMVTKFGMSTKVGPVMHGDSEFSTLSSKTRTEIENEVKLLIEAAKQRALNILRTHKDELNALAKALLDYETLSREEIEQVIKGKPLNKKLEES